MNKSFRGMLADGGQDRIRLSTNNGLIGYRIVKFEIMPENLASARQESTVKVFAQKQNTVTGTVNFNDPLLLAAAYIENYEEISGGSNNLVTIFDNIKFNQDVFITHVDGSTGENINYHLELEQVKLDLNESTVATLKDMRGRE